MAADSRFQLLESHAPDTDIVVWKVQAETPELASDLARKIFVASATRDLHLALVQLPLSWFVQQPKSGNSGKTVTCLRSVLMKPEHLDWLDRIWERLDASCKEVLGE